MATNQEQQSGEESSASNRSNRRRALPMPSDDVIRNSIARSLTQMLVNMRNAALQQKCRDFLQVDDLVNGAHIRILAHLEHIDAQREQRERAAIERKYRIATKK